VAQSLDLPGPVVRRAAGLQQHRSGSTAGEEADQLAAREPAPFSDAARLVRYGDLENGLGQVHGDGRMLLHGLLLSEVNDDLRSDVGTMMPLTSREESISSLQRTRRPRFRSGRSLCSLGTPLNGRPLGDRIR